LIIFYLAPIFRNYEQAIGGKEHGSIVVCICAGAFLFSTTRYPENKRAIHWYRKKHPKNQQLADR